MNVKCLYEIVAFFALLVLGAATLPASAGATTYAYDALNRLTEVNYDNCDLVAYTYDAAGNMSTIATTISTAKHGDFNASGQVDIADAILAMQVAVGLKPSLPSDNRCRDASGDSRTGMEDVIYVLQKVAEMR